MAGNVYDFKLSKVLFVTLDGRPIDFRAMMLEINIYEDIYSNCITGNILINTKHENECKNAD